MRWPPVLSYFKIHITRSSLGYLVAPWAERFPYRCSQILIYSIMEKLSIYRTAIDAVNFLVDFILKENFYCEGLHNDLWHLSESLTKKMSDVILDHVMPKVTTGSHS